MSRWMGGATLVACTALAIIVAGCGSGGGSDSPTSVSEADLHKDAEFWLSLDDPQRRELASICHDQQVKTATGGAEGIQIIQELDVDDYVALINKEYEEQGSADANDIEAACDEAKQELLGEQFRQLVPHLRGE